MTVQRTQGEVFISDLTKDGVVPKMLYWEPRKDVMKAKSKVWMDAHWSIK